MTHIVIVEDESSISEVPKPTLYLIDKNRHIRYVQIGEGRYTETEVAIRALLNE